MTKMAVLGRGSMRNKQQEEELRNSTDPKHSHLREELHVEITAFASPAEAHARLAFALTEVGYRVFPNYVGHLLSGEKVSDPGQQRPDQAAADARDPGVQLIQLIDILVYFNISSYMLSHPGDEANAVDRGGEQGIRRVDLLQRQRQRARDRFIRITKVGGREAEHLDPRPDVEHAVQAEAEPAKLPLPPLQEEGGPHLLASSQEVEGGAVGSQKLDIFGNLTSTYVT